MKLKSRTKQLILLFLSGIIVSIANAKLWILFSCLGLIPLFVIQNRSSKKEIAINGFTFGFGVGLGLFHWMIEGTNNYTGNSQAFGLLITLISTSFTGIYYGFLSWLTSFFWIKSTTSKFIYFINRLSIAAVWALIEFMMSHALEGFPLHNIRLGFSFTSSLYLIQLASIGGLLVLSFLTVLINLFLAEFYITKNIKFLFISVVLPLTLLTFGAINYNFYNPKKTEKSFKVAIVSDNTNPEIKWDSKNGNNLATTYFELCKEATSMHPDFIIWPESALPWSYSKDDDLLNELISISKKNEAIQVIGVNQENSLTQKTHNAAFFISNKNKVEGIYQKQILLKGIEQPIGNFIVPFLSQDGFVLSAGKNQKPIPTNFGKVGNLICNEVVNEKCSAEQVKNGANFFFNLSNDGWFKDTYISDLHFYYARLQAVENRKDICVSNNCGINGIISSDGTIVSENKDSKAICISGYIQPNNNFSFFTKYPYFFPLLFSLLICINLFINYKQFKNQF